MMFGFMRKKRIPVMYEMFGVWGDRIEWSNFPKRKITGWKQRIPQVGDLIKCPMESGKSGLFKMVSIDQMTDPPDMFFADTEPVGYLDDYNGKYVVEGKHYEKRI